MATTDMPAETQAAHDRWQRMWCHREHLLKVARRRSVSLEDAEDAVHEAMLRAAERPDLDDERLAAWLTTVTMRLCVDRHRQVSREAEVHRSPTLVEPGPVPVDEVVCDRAEARWLAVRSGELPARQAEALRLKSEDLDVSQVAVRMGLSYRTVESLLARARRTLRNSLAGTLGLVLFLSGRGRPRAGGHAQAVALASTAATLVVAGFALPHVHDGDGPGRGPGSSVSPAPEAWQRPYAEGDVPPSDGRGRTAASTPAAPQPSRAPGAESLLPLSVPSLPEVALSPAPELAAPEVPDVVPDVPDVVPEVPELDDVPRTPDMSDLPRAVPDGPAAPPVTDVPDAPVPRSAPVDALP
ncbi:sigma-70 family RNA polymerase sigma factor [Streptomyces canus]|uniref:RNA polymerase sigma factor n=1 Tax=Streptomyces canus TaxID=58343 RepID=UPI003CFAAE35